MLRLDMCVGETLHIGDDITIVIEEKNGQRSRVSVQAPRELQIRRTFTPANDNARTTKHGSRGAVRHAKID